MSGSFDYIVVGGGTAGLVVASRLSEDTDGQLNNRHLRQDTGKVLGGSSLTNFLMAMFPSQQNIDSWERMGNQGWSFKDLAPYFRKFSTSHSPTAAIREKLGGLGYYQSELSGTGPIQLSFDDDYSIVNASWFKTFVDLGLEMKADPRTGKAVGAFQNASTIEYKKNVRSSSVTAYYTETVANRPNLEVLMETNVQKIVTVVRDGEVSATGVQIIDKNGRSSTISAKREVILAAGALRTPQMLELSGIGDRVLLESLGIQSVIDNPNVGEHMQDHLMTSQQFPVRKGIPSTDALRDPALFQKIADEYAKTNGGLLAGMGTSVAYVPMANRAGVMPRSDRKELFDKHLSSGPAVSPARKREFKLIRELLEIEEEPAIQYMCFPGSLTVTTHPDTLTDMFTPTAPYDCIGIMALLNHPFSRGSVHISSADSAVQPTWDPNYCSHPLDVEILARNVQFVEKIVETAPFCDLIDPTAKRVPDIAADDLDRAREIVRSRTVSCFHIAGSCRMLPRELGGVVDERLLVHGTTNLRVVDASVFPLEPLGNIQTVVYAVAERAADFIKEDRRTGAVLPRVSALL
ncbi:Uu.00g105910.m01.CDS01 [Anthostomella pinea]|uniref:Uu.00g105910.m01.CDS01 n=1 Tax=Anthostomella pinea TaxID=933095 RepID=A0AAI8VDZ7_9PEZI|nr:Uu.00g105910.m01.CDS01 [Anthostomella pinea]